MFNLKPLRIILASSEGAPFAKVGGLADVAGSLPMALKSLGHNIKVFFPFYRQAKSNDFRIKPLKENIITRLGNRDFVFSLHTCKKDNVDFYFIKRDEFYDREFIYGTPSGDYPDNALRFAFFAKAVLDSAIILNFKPDIIHCNDWQTALMPFYLKYNLQNQAIFRDANTLFTIHNLAYHGLFDKEAMPAVDVGYEFFIPDALEFYGKFSFIKSGILYSDAINTVSKSYAKEILTKEFGCGLEGLLSVRRNRLFGILNGVDYSVWNPKTDGLIAANYDKDSPANKARCKKDLLAQMKLRASQDAPLLGLISRLIEQKGVDIIASCANSIIKLGCNLVILGTGEEKYHRLLSALAKKHPKNIAVRIAFDNPLAHKIEAGCDMFLMPSRFEPCGLNQMYSLKYGTIPVVRAVGGLNDTIIDYTQDKNSGNGFKFNKANAADFINALKRAVVVYKNKKKWQELLMKAMGCDFSWERSAKEYTRIYNIIK